MDQAPPQASETFTYEDKPVYVRLENPPSIVDAILLFGLSDDQALPFVVWAEYLLAKVSMRVMRKYAEESCSHIVFVCIIVGHVGSGIH